MNIFKKLTLLNRATWQPNMYHGWGKSQQYFEGWYYKIIDASEKHAIAFIPGIAMNERGEQHAFIQALDGKKCQSEYLRFDFKDFKASEIGFKIKIEKNEFSAEKMILCLPNLKGEVEFKNTTPWPKMFGAPGIMGWYGFVPFMECYHGIVSLDHNLYGRLEIDGETIDFTGGKGYIEKDWGTSFPSAWIWLQSNHFHQISSDPAISLIVSVARIPWLGTTFNGFIVGFWFEGKLYKFATYTGAQCKVSMHQNDVELTFKDKTFTLHIVAQKAGTGTLISPIKGDMIGKLSESLQSELHLTFLENNRIVYKGVGRNAGLEAAGDIDKLI